MHHNEEEGGLVLLMNERMVPLLGPLPSSLSLLDEAV
jgi:hypothetical protein